MSQKISTAVIKRLPRYYRHLDELLEQGVERISSHDLSVRMKVTASQIRQDLNNFGGFGQQGYGYNVKYLYDEIASILGLDERHKMIIIGAGNLGRAIAGYGNFEKRGFDIQGILLKYTQHFTLSIYILFSVIFYYCFYYVFIFFQKFCCCFVF